MADPKLPEPDEVEIEEKKREDSNKKRKLEISPENNGTKAESEDDEDYDGDEDDEEAETVDPKGKEIVINEKGLGIVQLKPASTFPAIATTRIQFKPFCDFSL
ncbi:uncharacterized protein [Primulina huaijiensis]|uniref:uncharacterized protein isoform X1 n=1 Tax=Primulina huaijiensis TaxID=1492673 RepID=UPI003CC7072C